MTTNFSKAQIGQLSHVYVCPPDYEFSFVTDPEYFEDVDDPLTIKRQTWRLVREEAVTFHPRTELCPTCAGEGEECPTCEDGLHPLAGEIEIVFSKESEPPTKEET